MRRAIVIDPKSAKFNEGIYARRIGSDLTFSLSLLSSNRQETNKIQSFERLKVRRLMARIKDGVRGGASEFMKAQSSASEDDSILKLLR
ncbi:hypothetical protein AVO42_09150 [Thiomicrospira sp. XS5]|nr:hypothetical protein AVO42_09150 [Thiomicrospira sp. XS5]